MKKFRIEDMVRGWFVGDFSPSVINTDKFEVCYRKVRKGQDEKKHFHRLTNEITVVVRGRIQINGETFVEGDIFLIDKEEIVDSVVLEDSEIIAVRDGSHPDDKFEIDG